MTTVDRELLQDMGLGKCTGFDVEVWHYEGLFWVYLEDSPTRIDLDTSILITDYPTRKAFFEKFLAEWYSMAWDSATWERRE